MTSIAPDLPDTTRLRLAELVASLSLAIDLEVGQPLEHVMRAALVAVRLGEAHGLGQDELADVYYLALLAYVGCTAEAHVIAAATGDDISNNAMVLPVHYGSSADILATVLRHLGRGYPALDRARLIARAVVTMARQSKPVTVAHCEVGQLLASQLGFGQPVIGALEQVYERWDGSGLPRALKGESIMRAMRVVHVAHDGALMYRLGGAAAAIATVRRHAGAAHDPEIAERFCRDADTLLADAGMTSAWEAVLEAEPGSHPYVSQRHFNTALAAMGDFADLKSSYMAGHSRRVSALAAAAAQKYGLSEAEASDVERSGLLHDLGRVGVSAGIWDKPGPLNDGEWERVRLHPYYTERVLARSPALAGLGATAGRHHERQDGSGDYRGSTAGQLTPAARLLAAADMYCALTEERAHRSALSPDAAVQRH